MTNTINILFLGDMVGKPGRLIVRDFLADKAGNGEYDFVIANAENASHGFGLTQKNHNELINYGINCLTSGNHIWDKRDIFNYIDSSDVLIRPLNYPDKTLGVGYRIFELQNCKIGVVNLLGRTFMTPVESPWNIIENVVEKIKNETNIIIVDFHAEASAEKICFGKYCAEIGVSAVFGTHTHVQTADERIINNRCAYITDAGFCGDVNGVIGMDYATSLRRLKTSLPERFDVASSGESQLNGIMVSIDISTGCALDIKRINYSKANNEENMIMKG